MYEADIYGLATQGPLLYPIIQNAQSFSPKREIRAELVESATAELSWRIIGA